MPIFDERHTSLAEAYAKADDYLERYWETDGPDREGLLNEGAQILCKSLSEIASDEKFWRALDEAAAWVESEGRFEREVAPVLRDLDTLMSLERKVLRERGLSQRKVERLLTEVLTGASLSKPNPGILRRLRKPLMSASKAICKGPKKSWGETLRWAAVVSNGVLAAGGLGLVVINGVSTTLTLGMSYGSILTGATVAVGRLEAIDKILEEGEG
ncbi:MAG TPA: hypothetical protein VLT90_16045 [Terriglobales bacterium]|nr:hypothetical protein [Terriglobales bacterium]